MQVFRRATLTDARVLRMNFIPRPRYSPRMIPVATRRFLQPRREAHPGLPADPSADDTLTDTLLTCGRAGPARGSASPSTCSGRTQLTIPRVLFPC